MSQSVSLFERVGFCSFLITVSLSIKTIGECSESISNSSLTRVKRDDKFLDTKKSIKSGTLFLSVGQYVGFPVVCTFMHFNSTVKFIYYCVCQTRTPMSVL